MYYLIDNDTDFRFDSVDDVLDYCVTTDYYENDTDGFNEYLDQDGCVDICGYDFAPSDILYQMSRDIYNRELTYWAENQVEEGKENFEYELENCRPGNWVYVCNYQVYVYDDEEADEDTDGDDLKDAAFDDLEERLEKQKQDEAKKFEEEQKIGNDLLSALGIQII